MNPGKILIISGIVFVAAGVIVVLLERVQSGKFLFRLPGDIFVQRGNWSFYFPITTCILVSIILSIIFMLFRSR